MTTDTDLTLVDYFAVIGLDKTSGLKPDPSWEFLAELSGTFLASERLPPLERAYQSKVLARFPEKRRGMLFPPEISSLCMPKGLKFYTETKVPMNPEFHSFVITREDGTRMNGCALMLFEEVKDESIKQAMFDLQMAHVKQLAAAECSSGDIYDSRVRQQPGTVSFGNHTMPRHISAKRNRQKRISYYDNTSKPIFVSKCIAVLTRIPMVFTPEKILRTLAEVIKPNCHSLPVPLESFIYWVLHEVPLPIPGTTLQLNYSGIDLIVIRPPTNDLPFFDYPLQHLFKYISIDKFLKLFTCFLLEHQILLCSKHMDRLMLVAESLVTLVFPFRWQLTYVPILPYSQLKFIEAPVPYLMGLCYDDFIPDQIYQSNICILDIDNKKLDYPEDVPPFPKHRQLGDEIAKILEQARTSILTQFETQVAASSEVPKVVMRKKNQNGGNRRADLMSFKRISRSFDNLETILAAEDVYRQQLEKEAAILNETQEKMPNNDGFEPVNQNQMSEETQHYFQGLRLNQAVRDLLLNHFACLFYSYDAFVVSENSIQASRDSVVNFDKASFLSDQPDSFLPFLAAFLETQMFASFIDAKILSHFHSSFDENIVVFDQKILQVRERLAALKAQTPTIEKPTDILLVEESREVFCPLPTSSIQMDYEVRQPKSISGTAIRNYGGFFPEMDAMIFETNVPINSTHSPWKQQKQRQRTNSLFEESSLSTPKKRPSHSSTDESTRSKEHWIFVEQLLKETKTKTKRMLVMKMGKEAVHLGHNDVGITGVEENTLVATFCDLLERVWTHGLKKKHGKSALWTHVLSHQEREKNLTTPKSIEHSSNLTPEYLPIPQKMNEIVSNQATDSEAIQRDSSGSGLNELIESLKQLSKPSETEENWSKPLLMAANFFADKLTQPGNAEIEPGLSDFDNELTRQRSRKPLPRSSSVTRFASWAKDTITATAVAASAAVRDLNVNQPETSRASVYPAGHNTFRSRIPDIPRPPTSFHKSSSVSDFSPHWSVDSNSSNLPSSASSAIGIPTNSNFSSTSTSNTTKSRNRPPQELKKRSLSRPRSPMERDRQLSPLPTHIGYDLKSVMEMSEIKTDIGCARAFVRLALERKLLHKHFKTIFANDHLLQKLYKRYAFLRSEDEREQFLFHILSLNAVDFSCFTNTFIATKMQYEVLLVAGIDRFASASVWIMITGSLGNTSIINLPSNTLQFTFDHKNLGVLSTLRIGHNLNQKTSNPSKWFLDYILVRNNITGQTFRFNCGRWFGRGVDDGALERLLVAEILPRESPNVDGISVPMSTSIFGGLVSRPESPISGIFSTSSLSGSRGNSSHYSTQSLARRRSPSVTRSGSGTVPDGGNVAISDLHHQLGVAVNALMKHFLTDQTFTGGGAALTPLLCGENGLVFILEQVFSFGRKKELYSFFQKLYPWDYVEAVFVWFVNFFRHGEGNRINKDQRSLIIFAYQLVRKIKENNVVGKEGKFHVFILLTIRDHILASLLPLMVWTPVTAKLYTDDAFVRQPSHITYLSKLLASLNEFNFVLEKSLTHGIDI